MQERRQTSRDVEKTFSIGADDTDGIDSDGELSDDDLRRIQNASTYVDRISAISQELQNELHPASIGRFEIVKSIGEGGFAHVYLARDPQLDRLVAIKVLHLQRLLSANARARFKREAKAVGMLSHPNIVPIFEIGDDYVAPYIVSEYCEGATLLSWIKDSGDPVEPRLAGEIVSILADAMQYSHSRGVVHRDLKPANIVFAHADNAKDGDLASDTESLAESIRILDFGLAKLTGADESLTIDGDIVGTPAYMAPEVARGEEATAASDIYSLGVILYRLLTNDMPYAGNSHLAILRSIETEIPLSPQERLNSIPRNLDAIVMKCMRKLPSSRYQNAHELHTDLEHWLGGRPVNARPISRLEKIKLWYASETRFANALLLAFSILIAGICVTTAMWRDSEANLIAATESLKIAGGANRVSAITARDYTRALDDFAEVQQILQSDSGDNPALKAKLDEIVHRIKNANDEKSGTDWSQAPMLLEQDPVAAWAARIVAAKQCEMGDYHDGIATLRSAAEFTKGDRISLAITGGSYAYVYGLLDRERDESKSSDVSNEEIDSLREELRTDALQILSSTSKSGSLWLDDNFWGALYDDEEFKRTIANAEYPMFLGTRDVAQPIAAFKGAVTNRIRNSFTNLFDKSDEENETEDDSAE